MNVDVLAELLAALDDHIVVMRDVVSCAQAQQRAVISFDIDAMRTGSDEMGHLVGLMGAAESRTLSAAHALTKARALDLGQNPSLSVLAEQLGAVDGAQVLDRATKLGALGGALRELNAMTSLQAQRGLRTVRAYTSLLAGSTDAPRPELYGPRGHQQQDAPRARLLSGRL